MLTGADLPDRRWGLFVYDETPLAAGAARYVGEPVAAVAAADLATARAAAALIEVDYEELTPVLSIEEALRDGAVAVHPDFDSYEKRPNLGFERVNEIARQEFSEGDVEAAWADCDVVVEGVYDVPSQSPCLSGAGFGHRRVRPGRQADCPVGQPVGQQGAGDAVACARSSDVENPRDPPRRSAARSAASPA